VLEPYAVKVARTVLRGERESNLPDLLDNCVLIGYLRVVALIKFSVV